MIALIQRVKSGRVVIDGKLHSEIASGFVVFLGIKKGDEDRDAIKLAGKIVKLRIMNDPKRKMNFSILDTSGEILVVSQFTLASSFKGGRRPDFFTAMEPEMAKKLYELFIKQLKSTGVRVETGRFSAYMEIELVNDGPVTFILDSREV